MTLLVNATFIRTICPELSTKINDENAKIKTYVDHAQLKDVRPLIGLEFWKEIIDNNDQETGVFRDLLDGGDYDYSGSTYENPGLKEVIARYAYARYSRFGHKNDTSFGSIVKENQDARETSLKEKQETFYENKQLAFEQWSLVYEFLCRKASDYPNWERYAKKSYKTRVIRKP